MPKLVSATYHLDVKTAEFIADNGDHLLRSGGTPAWRFNNPGNMRPAGRRVITTSIGRATMANGGAFLIFPDYETGRSELKRLLRDPDSYAPLTIAQMAPKFAPSTDANDPDKYLHFVTKRTALNKDTKLGDLTDSQLDKIVDSIETMEGYHALASTRSEKWIKGATIALTDGARPIANQQVVVRQGSKEKVLSTGETGVLPAIPLIGGSIEILVHDAQAQLQKIGTVAQTQASKSYLLVRDMFVAKASTAPHVPSSPRGAVRRAPISYRIEPHDTLSKIAKRFKTSVDRIKADNHLGHSDLIFVGKTLIISGDSQLGSATANSSASAPHVSLGTAGLQKPHVEKTSPSTAPLAVPESKAPGPAATAVDISRSQAGQGRPLGLFPPDQPRASWMAIAIAEAERWGGADESVITKTINYHAEIDDRNGFKTLVGSTNAWCAAFVNWVMMRDGRALVAGNIGRHRARNFVGDPSFPQIEKPVFGAIAVEANLGHVMFVYGVNPKTKNIVVLGGNQGGGGSFGGTIDFAEFKPSKIHGYYVPLTYLPFAQQEIAKGLSLPEASAADLNKVHHIKDPKGHGTR